MRFIRASRIVGVAVVFLAATSGLFAADRIPIANPQGFHTAGPAEFFGKFWDSLQENRKLQGQVADRLTREQIDSVVMLEVGMAVAVAPKFPSLEDELLGFLSGGTRFSTAALPDSFGKARPRKLLSALVRTRKGDVALVTRYEKHAVLEINGRVGVVNLKPWP